MCLSVARSRDCFLFTNHEISWSSESPLIYLLFFLFLMNEKRKYPSPPQKHQ